jgi:hypothetical protein
MPAMSQAAVQLEKRGFQKRADGVVVCAHVCGYVVGVVVVGVVGVMVRVFARWGSVVGVVASEKSKVVLNIIRI